MTRFRPLLMVALVGCSSGADDSLEVARRDGLRAGFAVERPYAFVDSTGRVTGEAPEVLRRAARDAEVRRVQWVPLEFQQLIPSLLAGRIDVIASGMFVTPARSRRVRFSRPTACVRPLLVMPAVPSRREPPAAPDNGHPERGSREPSCKGCRIAVLDASVEQAALRDLPGYAMVVVPDLATAVTALNSGAADAIAISAPTARRLMGADSGLVTAGLILPESNAARASGCAAFAFRPDDPSLAAQFDDVLERFIGSAEHLRIAERFGFTAREIP